MSQKTVDLGLNRRLWTSELLSVENLRPLTQFSAPSTSDLQAEKNFNEIMNDK